MHPHNRRNLTVFRRGFRIIERPESHLTEEDGYPVLHIWHDNWLQAQRLNSWTVFREREFPNSETLAWPSTEYLKPYHAKHIVWEPYDEPDFDALKEPTLKITEGVINAIKFETLYEEAKNITIPIVGIEIPYVVRNVGGFRLYPAIEIQFGYSYDTGLGPVYEWIYRVEKFLEAQLGVS